MNSGLLIYRFPSSQGFSVQIGDWIKSDGLMRNAFFVSAFDDEGYFVFNAHQTINLTEAQSYLHTKKVEHNQFMTQPDYLERLADLMDAFSNTQTEKVVFSRILRASIENTMQVETILNRLSEHYGDKALVYALSSPELGTWVGATPEVMLQGNQGTYHTMSLAGTKKDAASNWTPKEEREQQLVTDFMVEKLSQLEVKHLRIEGPTTFFTGAVYHLKTDIYFQATNEQLPHVLMDLNPTPAVCGIPRENALSLIRQYEPHNRSLYTGLIGYIGENESNVYVNLRCMQLLADHSAAIYVGGGITDESNPIAEWEETENKSKTLTNMGGFDKGIS